MPRALVTGITGQDGSYLAEFLLDKGYDVYGLIRRSSVVTDQRIRHLIDRVELIDGDLLDQLSLIKAMRTARPDEVYNLAAQSFVPTSWGQPVLTGEFTALGVTKMLEAVRVADWPVRFYQASSSEMFGKVQEVPQTENTPFYPRSPYGVAKVYGHWITVNYREAYGYHASNGILFNHESPIRGETFVTRKITRSLARIKLGLQDCLYLGNLNARRDWGHARDFVEAQWLMLQQPEPEDLVIATGVQHSVREFVEATAAELGMAVAWKGEGPDEKGYDASGRAIVALDPRYYRPAEVDTLLGDPSRARDRLGWRPKVSFRELVAEMAREDLKAAERDLALTLDAFSTAVSDAYAKRMPHLVAERDGRVLGYAYAGNWRPRPAYKFSVEDSIYIDKDAVGQGVGKALLPALIEQCAALGKKQMVAVIGGRGNAAGAFGRGGGKNSKKRKSNREKRQEFDNLVAPVLGGIQVPLLHFEAVGPSTPSRYRYVLHGVLDGLPQTGTSTRSQHLGNCFNFSRSDVLGDFLAKLLPIHNPKHTRSPMFWHAYRK